MNSTLLPSQRAGLGFSQRLGAVGQSRQLQMVRASGPVDRRPRHENVPGTFYVDHTCIDCDTCRWMDSATYSREGGMSAVTRQPETAAERLQALQALISCPTHSIHAVPAGLAPGEMQRAHDSMPLPVDGCPNVYHCGYHSELSYGAAAYLICQPGGNIMVDSPRFTPALAKRLEALGGVKRMLLSHRDDVADHKQWAHHTGCTRIMHETECNANDGTNAVEYKLSGEGPWDVLGDDCTIVFTPGHTAGCISLLHKSSRALLTGDHLAWSNRLHRLSIMRAYNWFSVPQQLESAESLLAYDWLHVLPGHGRPAHFNSLADRDACMQVLLLAEHDST